jgi:hypothetical protein
MRPTHLRHALKILEYTNKSLADEITSFRTDNQRTSEATVSRWISGATAPDPCLLMFLRERLAQHLIKHYKPRLPKPVHIAVGGGKGGSGSSTVALSLAVAARDIGYRVALIILEENCNAHYVLEQEVSDFYVALLGDSEHKAEDYDFIFVDLPSRMVSFPDCDYESLSKQLELVADFLVLPVNLIGLDRSPALKAFKTLEALPSAPIWMPIQCSPYLELSYFVDHFEDIEPWMSLLCSRPIIYSMSPINFVHEHLQTTWKFVHEDAAKCFHQILEDIADRLSISLDEPISLDNARELNLEDLVDRLA